MKTQIDCTVNNTDRCMFCSARGDLYKCLFRDCVAHHSWINKELLSRVNELQAVINKVKVLSA